MHSPPHLDRSDIHRLNSSAFRLSGSPGLFSPLHMALLYYLLSAVYTL